MKKIIKNTIIVFEIWFIYQLLMLIFVGYEQIVYWGNKESWCTKTQILQPQDIKTDRSVILVHGYGGSPLDYKPLALELQQQGFFVVIPLMPDQGKETFAYRRGDVKAKDYVKWLDNIIAEETNRFHKKPYLVGFSMGATIATICAEEKIEKLILLAPFYALPTQYNTAVSLNKVLRYLLPIIPKFASGQLFSKKGRNTYSPGSFIPSTRVFGELTVLVEMAKKKIPETFVPILIIGSTNDYVAHFSTVTKLFADMNNVKIIDYPESNHILLYDYATDKIIQDVISFLKK